MLRVAVGQSCDPEADAAIVEVLAQCAETLAGEIPKAGVVFAAIDFDHAQILQALDRAYPGIQIIGGTTDGEMSSVSGFQEDSLTVMLFSSETIDIKAGVGRAVSANPTIAVQAAVSQATATLTSAAKLCLAFPESLTTSGVEILTQLKQTLGAPIPIVGGTTADQNRFKQTYQFFQTEVLSDAVPILLFSGDLLVSCGVASGWTPIGKAGTVTKVEKNVVHEIDDRPAQEFFHHYVGDSFSAAHGLAVFEANASNFYIRMPNRNQDSQSGSVSFLADVPEQATVQIIETNRANLLAASKTSMLQALETYPGIEPIAAIFVSCCGRRLLLGLQVCDEFAAIQACSPSLTSCGFYSNGEISPFEISSESRFHNQTLVTLLLGTR